MFDAKIEADKTSGLIPKLFDNHNKRQTNDPILRMETRNTKYWPKMKTLHFICLNICFASIHVLKGVVKIRGFCGS